VKYPWLLFDADDTLFDYPRAEAHALKGTFEALNLPYHADYLPMYHLHNRHVWKEFEQGQLTSVELRIKRFQMLFSEIGLAADLQTFSNLYLINLAGGSELFEGVADTIQVLSNQHHLSVITNGLAEVQRPRLLNSSIHPFIEKIFISEEMGVAKPAGAFFDIVFKELGDPPKSEVLVIGDSLTSDMLGGIQYGLATCWVNPSRKTTDLPVTYQIQSIPELIPLLD
jgi:2-haloacid dehalogenase